MLVNIILIQLPTLCGAKFFILPKVRRIFGFKRENMPINEKIYAFHPGLDSMRFIKLGFMA